MGRLQIYVFWTYLQNPGIASRLFLSQRTGGTGSFLPVPPVLNVFISIRSILFS